jgi:hypothetical protein
MALTALTSIQIIFYFNVVGMSYQKTEISPQKVVEK